MQRFGIAVLAICFALAAPARASDVSMNPAQVPNGAYRLDPAHSVVLFSVKHIGLTEYYGRFDDVSGTLDYDGNVPDRSHVTITIAMDSTDTPSQLLNRDLKGPEVFDAAKFPQARFVSTGIERTGPDHGRITGNLTIRDVTKPVTLDVTFRGATRNALDDAPTLGFHASATIKRSDFGLTGMVWSPLVGDEVTLTIEAVFEQESQ